MSTPDAADRWMEAIRELDEKEPFTGLELNPGEIEVQDELLESWLARLHPHDRLGQWARTRWAAEHHPARSEGIDRPGFEVKPYPQPPVFRFEDTLEHPELSPRAHEYGIEGHPAHYAGRANQPLFDDGAPKEPTPTPLDPHKLFGGEIVQDPEGKRWRVAGTTGTSTTLATATLYKEDYTGTARKLKPKDFEGWLFVSGKPAGGKGSSWKAKPLPPKVDDSGMVTLGEPAGGTQGARFAEGADGSKYVVKTYAGDSDRVATELLGNALYRRLGVAVPEAGELHFDGKPAVASKMVAGEVRPWSEPSAALAEGFMADALLANWDVVGLDQDNVLWDGDEPIRVDQGGTLEFRAQGGRKDFGPVPAEVWTMAGPQGQAHGTMALTPEGKRAGAAQIATVLTPDSVDELVDAAPFKDLAMRERVRQNLKARIDWMGRYSKGEVGEPKPLEGQEAAAALGEAQKRLQLYPEQATALDGFVNGWAGPVNAHLRSGAGAKQADEGTKFVVREMDSLLKAAKTPEDVYVNVALPRAPAVGSTLEDRGYLTGSLEPGPAQEVAGPQGAVLKLLVPKGRNVLLVPPLASQLESGPPAQPELVLPRGARAKVSSSAGGVAEAVLL